jgi:glutamyl-tRNA synthetase
MVLLRADGTPTYMLAVVVDDHDMDITHVIRGDDHLTNAFRQYQLYRALGWEPPMFAHIPLLHGADGSKLSKRHGALGVDAYRDQGFLPEALFNYLLRLGWSHGDDEIIAREDAIAWFDLDAVGRGPARFDMAKLTSLNGHYLRSADDRRLGELVFQRLAGKMNGALAERARERIVKGMPGMKERAKTLEELADKAVFYAVDSPIPMDHKAMTLLDAKAKQHLGRLSAFLKEIAEWTAETLEKNVRLYVDADQREGLKLRDVAQPLRAALTGSAASPPIFEVMEVLGHDETLARINDASRECNAEINTAVEETRPQR